jgi:DNA-binding PadR family transcriptional regulator
MELGNIVKDYVKNLEPENTPEQTPAKSRSYFLLTFDDEDEIVGSKASKILAFFRRLAINQKKDVSIAGRNIKDMFPKENNKKLSNYSLWKNLKILKEKGFLDYKRENRTHGKNHYTITDRGWQKFKQAEKEKQQQIESFKAKQKQQQEQYQKQLNPNGTPPPTAKEMLAYIEKEKLHNVDYLQFYKYYYTERNGICNGRPIRSWKNLLRLWNNNTNGFIKKAKPPS